MGKKRRLAKLERRATVGETRRTAAPANPLSWARLGRVALRALVFALLGTLLQVAGLALGIEFLATLPGQLLLFGALYLLLFRWINADLAASRRAPRR